MSANTEMTMAEFKSLLRESSRGQLEDVLEGLFKASQKTVKEMPDAETAFENASWNGSIDRAFEYGQWNGEGRNAAEVLNAILNNLG